ncbi:hypothetical protein LPB140_03050 [Sphingorhabdus lutea]|uniref:Gluconokinase n=1 Tax=Sphingorhabdus lutea TaxID=1913578 RepID=A0A1L3JEG7_9SPHN|nr:hypothetical protein LPB140_03050 [Sphingorhabdus lutea]
MDQLLVIMGVSGSGKSTISGLLSQMQNWPMVEGDDFHPAENRDKMSRGVPLCNADRMPWLSAISDHVNAADAGPIILACSALNEVVRGHLNQNVQRRCRWIYLQLPANILEERLLARKGHFMPVSLLQSQLAALEIPHDAIRINGEQDPAKICADILQNL